jgi:hypothetical protein
MNSASVLTPSAGVAVTTSGWSPTKPIGTKSRATLNGSAACISGSST